MKVNSLWRIGLFLAVLVVCGGCSSSSSPEEEEPPSGLPDGGGSLFFFSSSSCFYVYINVFCLCGIPVCTMDNECGHGMCNVSECVCHPKWTNSSCDYQRRSQKSAFLYGFFLGVFGAGRYYLSLAVSGALQTVLFVCCVFNIFLGCCCDELDINGLVGCDRCDDELEILSKVMAVIVVAATVVWFVFPFSFLHSFCNHSFVVV